MIPEPDCGDFVPMDETLKEKIALFRYPDGYAGETVDVLYDPYDPARPVHFRALASRRPAPPPRAGQRRPCASTPTSTLSYAARCARCTPASASTSPGQRRPCASTPTSTLSYAARCARFTSASASTSRGPAATLRVYAYVHAPVLRTARPPPAGHRLHLA